MTDWGLPDWTSEEGYPSDDWNVARWRWEFIRRREDYRRAFHTLAPYAYKECEEHAKKCIERACDCIGDNHFQLIEIDSRYFVAHPVWGQYALFDYYGLPNPKYSDVPSENIEPIHANEHEKKVLEHFDISQVWNHETPPHALIPEGYVAIRFALTLPIAQQLEGLQSFLEDKAREARLRTTKRLHPKKWRTYLRVLDGRAEKASWAELASFLPEWIGSRTPQAARDIHKQAMDLQFSFWPVGLRP